MQVANLLYNVALVAALWATGVGLGLSSDVGRFVAPLRRRRILTTIIVLDVVAIPALVWALSHAFNLSADSATGLILVGIASGGPLGIIACRIAGADARAAFSFVVILETVNAVAIPIWVALLLPPGVRVSPIQVFATLIILVLLPLVVGLGLRARYGPRVARLANPLATLSNVLVLFVIALVLVRDSRDVASAISNGVAAVAAITILAALAAGWLLGGPERNSRAVVALVTGVRANALALAIARASFPSRTAVQAAVVAFGVFSVTLPLAASFLLARRTRREIRTLRQDYDNA